MAASRLTENTAWYSLQCWLMWRGGLSSERRNRTSNDADNGKTTRSPLAGPPDVTGGFFWTPATPEDTRGPNPHLSLVFMSSMLHQGLTDIAYWLHIRQRTSWLRSRPQQLKRAAASPLNFLRTELNLDCTKLNLNLNHYVTNLNLYLNLILNVDLNLDCCQWYFGFNLNSNLHCLKFNLN